MNKSPVRLWTNGYWWIVHPGTGMEARWASDNCAWHLDYWENHTWPEVYRETCWLELTLFGIPDPPEVPAQSI